MLHRYILDNYSNYTNIIDKQWDGASSYSFMLIKPQFLLGNIIYI